MLILGRAITYATLFVGLVFVFVPSRLLTWTGIEPPAKVGWSQAVGMVLAVVGALLAMWCVLSFGLVGRGTPAPFDPPRRLVSSGPYRYLRNPMYLGSGLALGGAALFYNSLVILAYLILLFFAANFWWFFTRSLP